MSMPVALSCSCGALQGALTLEAPSQGTRLVCHCADCQAFPRFLGKADAFLDAQGGTDLVQTAPDRFVLTAGQDRLAALKLTEKGPARWYAACCGTPLANTPFGGGFPFVTLLARNLDAARRDDVLGPVLGHVFAKKEADSGAVLPAPPRMSLLQVFGRVFLARLRGAHRKSVFYDPTTLAPVAEAHLLTEEEQAKAYGAAG